MGAFVLQSNDLYIYLVVKNRGRHFYLPLQKLHYG
jgi:hypothetical protein